MSSDASRRLAAILFADIAGYSALLGKDEDGTIRELRQHQNAILPLISEHGGKVVDLAGDGILAEFESAHGALAAGMAIQSMMADRNREVPPARRLMFRVGLNLGDVVHEGERIFGEGIGVASRLQALAEPGGICISAKVYEEVRNRTEATFRDLGEQQLRNIDRPVRAYVLDPSAPPAPAKSGGVPTLAVMPFANLTGDPEQDYFADGIVDDIIVALSSSRAFSVISRSSTFAYKGKATDIRQAAQQLGAKYVLEGSVRRLGEKLRISAQLLDGGGGANLWAERFDGPVTEVFDMQDRVCERVAATIEPQLRYAEIERSRRERPGSIEAYDLYLQALPKMDAELPSGNAEGYRLVARAVELSPDYGPALFLAAWFLEHRIHMGWPRLHADDDIRFKNLLDRAIECAREDARILGYCGYLAMVAKQYDRARALAQRALELSPSNLTALGAAGIVHLHLGSVEMALSLFRRRIELCPNDPGSYSVVTGVVHAHMYLGNYEEALKWASRSMAINAKFPPTHWMMIAANAHLGRMDEARLLLANYLALEPSVTLKSIHDGQPNWDPKRTEATETGLRLAGMPEG